MTISSTVRKSGPYAGTGVVTAFSFNFKVFAAADLYVVRADSFSLESTLVLNSDYTVALNADQNANPGGTVTLTGALASGFTLTISSQIQYLQPTDITNQGGFYPKVITDALDRLTIFAQQLSEKVDRSIKVAFSDSNPAKLIPTAMVRANKLLAFDANGDPTIAIPSAGTATQVQNDLLNSNDPSKGAAMVALKQFGSGAISRTLQAKLWETVSVLDFTGADPSGTNDSTAAIQAAINTGKSVYLPAGNYKLTGTLTNSYATRIYGESIGLTTITAPATGDVIVLSNSYSEVSDITFTCATTRTSGAYININTASRSNRVHRFKMNNAFIGVNISANAVITTIRDAEIMNTAPTTGIGILVGGGNDTFIDKVVMDNPSASQPLCGIKLKSTQATWITDTDVIHSGIGLLIAPDSATGDQVTWCFFKSLACDTGSGDGVQIAPVGTAQVRGLFFSNSWFSTNNRGVYLNSTATIDTVDFTDCTLFNNNQQGALVNSGYNIEFKGCRVSGNSQSPSGSYAGLEFGNNMTYFSVKHTRSGPVAGFANTQKYGLLIGTGANLYEVTDNNFAGNVTASYLDNSIGSGGTRTVRDNIGAKTRSSGVAPIGTGVAKITVNHGLIGTPSIVLATPSNTNLGSLAYWVGGITATTFDINLSGNTTAAGQFNWEATAYE